ncbi:MAG: ATP-binding protein [Gammaproteobacteria bacterium]|jgi:signal transduction histidine kinase
MTDDAHLIDLAILEESLRSRSSQAKLAFVGLFLAIGPFFIALQSAVSDARLALWMVPIVLILAWRAVISQRLAPRIDSADRSELLRFDRWLRFNSCLNQFWVGTGVWTVANFGDASTPFFVTLAICLFGVGAMISLASDYRSVAISIPLLIGQAILYWFLEGNYHIGIAIIPVMVLIIAAGWLTQRSLNESIAIRFENTQLMRRLEEEKATALDALKDAEEANRSKSLFLAAASHDLRQPLYAITLLNDTLADKPLPDSVKEIVRQQGNALETLNNLLGNLLDLSRLDSGNVEVNIEWLEIDGVLADLAMEFEPVCARKGLTYEWHRTYAYVLSDVDLLTRLLRNLISNAVRYTDEGRVSVNARMHDALLEIEIADTGAGIEEADQTRIFEEFVQLNNPQRDREEGVGLGLSIVQRLGRLLDLTIKLDSKVGKGTTVTFDLPLASPAQEEASHPKANVPSVSYRANGLYVWIVEDDELVRSALGRYLEDQGISYDFAVERSELLALQRARGWPDYALLDDMLGENDTGLELATWLAGHMPSERILIVTGNVDTKRWDVLQESGFHVMLKPVSGRDLREWLAPLDQAL